MATNAKSVTLPKTGHWVMEENPQGTMDALVPFLTGQTTRASAPGPRSGNHIPNADAMTSQHPGTIFITGSSSGLGRAAAKLFSSRGWTVIATMRNPDKERELASLPNIALLPLDITDAQQITRAVTEATTRGNVDVVFNNAGYGMAGPLEGVTDEQMLRMVSTNLMGPIRTTKAFIPHFRAKRAGLFINTTSIGGPITVPFNSMYHATKWALEG